MRYTASTSLKRSSLADRCTISVLPSSATGGGRYSIPPPYGSGVRIDRDKRKRQHRFNDNCLSTGVLGGIRTPDPLVRSQILYPTELQAQILIFITFESRDSTRLRCPETHRFAVRFPTAAQPCTLAPSSAGRAQVRFPLALVRS